jgi:hypothetical protein
MLPFFLFDPNGGSRFSEMLPVQHGAIPRRHYSELLHFVVSLLSYSLIDSEISNKIIPV